MKQVDSQSALGATGVQPLGIAGLPALRVAAVPLVRAIWVPVVLGAILVLAGVVRTYDLVDNPPGFFTDEASSGYNAYAVLHTGKDEHGERLPLFFKSFGEYRPPIFVYSQIPLIAVLGLSELSVRLTSAIYGMLTVLAVYLLVRALFREQGVALAAAAILAISPWHIFYSRAGFGEIIAWPFFLTISLWLFYLGTRQPRYWLAAAAAFGLTLYSNRPAWVTLPPLLLILAVLYHRELIKHWRISLASLLILAAMSAPAVHHAVFVQEDRARNQSILTLDLGTQETINRFFEHYRLHFSRAFLFDAAGEENLRHTLPGSSWIYEWQVPFLILGFLALLWKPTRPKLVVLALLLLFPIASAAAAGSPSSSRAILGVVPFTVITAYGVVTPVRILNGWRTRPAFTVAARGLGGLVLVGTVVAGGVGLASFLDTYHGSYKQVAEGGWGWQWGARAIMDRFLAERNQYDELVMEPAFNGPEMLLRFYAPNNCPNCLVGLWDRHDPAKRQLFALRPENMPPGLNFDVREFLYYPNGQLAFVLAEITGPFNLPRGDFPNVGLGGPERTLTELDQAIESDPNAAPAHVERANLYWNLATYLRVGAYWPALLDYNGAIQLDPNLALAYYNRGNIYSTMGIFDWAVGDYGTAGTLNPSLVQAQNNTGNVYNRVREFDAAITNFNQAIALAPDLALPYANRAVALLGKGDLQPAMADLERALQLDPSLALGHYVRGRANAHFGTIDAAFADLSEAIRLDSTFAEAFLERGRLHAQQGRNREAVTDLDRALDLDRDFALGYAHRGLAYLALGDFDRGAANLDKAVALDRAFVNSPSERNRQYQWSLLDLDESYASGLSRAAAAAPDPATAERLSPLVSYLAARAREQRATAP